MDFHKEYATILKKKLRRRFWNPFKKSTCTSIFGSGSAHAAAGELSDVRAAVEAGLLQPVGLPEVAVAPAARTEL